MLSQAQSSPLVVCIPYAGVGSGAFHGWKRLAPPDLEVVGLTLPGREWRIGEAPLRTVCDAASDLMKAVLRMADGERSVALFGHSLGAVLAFELAARLEAFGTKLCSVLIVSGSPDPWSGRRQGSGELEDQEFVDRLEALAGYRHPALEVDEVRALMLPTLRADVEMHETYRPAANVNVSLPVVALRGDHDLLVSREAVKGWARSTSGQFSCRELPGGHMYLLQRPREVLGVVKEELKRHGRKPAGSQAG